MSSTRDRGRLRRQQPSLKNLIFPMLDILALATWGIVILKYWLGGKLNLLIHPNYFVLVIATGFALLMFAAWRIYLLWSQVQQRVSSEAPAPVVQHISVFPPGWSSALLLTAAILGLLVTPRVFTSQTALDRGVAEAALTSRSQPQAFRGASDPGERTLIEWVRTLNVYPEPDAYTGQKVKVQGFVVHSPNLPSQYLLVSRFIITCCAADAYPVGLPVKLDGSRDAYPPDTWLEIEGQMITENLNGKRQLTIDASSIQKIPEPDNPYYY